MERPTLRQRFNSIATFLWDSENSKVLGRGGRSWAEIGLFYLIYYACLSGFFAATLAVFYETLSGDEPKLTGDSSLIKGNPGLGFRPMPDIEDLKISVKPVLGKNKDYVGNLNDFLDAYHGPLDNTDCRKVDKPRVDDNVVSCKLDYYELTNECKKENDYGMADGKPCILIKLNKVFDWVPSMWEEGDADIPSHVEDVYSKTVVPIRCHTKDKGDMDKLGNVVYYPHQGFHVGFFPYRKQKDYRAPVVFAQFTNITRGETFDIECRVYAKNIDYDRTEIQGSTQFKLYVSKK